MSWGVSTVSRSRPSGTRHSAGVRAECELMLFEFLHAGGIHDDENHVRFAYSDLQSDASALNAHGRRRAPARAGTAGNHSLSILGAHNSSRPLSVPHAAPAPFLFLPVLRNPLT